MKKGDDTKDFLGKITKEHNFEIKQITSLAGGDINQVFKISTSSGEEFVVKLNDPDKYPGMFSAEKRGLESLRSTGTFTIPKALATGVLENKAYLLLEFIKSSSPATEFWSLFGKQLAEQHKKTNDFFGFDANNYIGTLPQQNNKCSTAAEFYISQRLEPQIKISRQRGFDLGDTAALFKKCSEIIPDEPSSLIHGDLWSGNYLIDSEGFPGLIDPAVAYAPREMDLAMMKLFGGFDPSVFQHYDKHFPLVEDCEQRIPLWQLYYLLVHLNIFGAGYLGRVISIIGRYS